jgi:hypothetical protein
LPTGGKALDPVSLAVAAGLGAEEQEDIVSARTIRSKMRRTS